MVELQTDRRQEVGRIDLADSGHTDLALAAVHTALVRAVGHIDLAPVLVQVAVHTDQTAVADRIDRTDRIAGLVDRTAPAAAVAAVRIDLVVDRTDYLVVDRTGSVVVGRMSPE